MREKVGILSASNRLGDMLSYESAAKFEEKFRKSTSMGSNTETTHEEKHRKDHLHLPHTPPAPRSESNNTDMVIVSG